MHRLSIFVTAMALVLLGPLQTEASASNSVEVLPPVSSIVLSSTEYSQASSLLSLTFDQSLDSDEAMGIASRFAIRESLEQEGSVVVGALEAEAIGGAVAKERRSLNAGPSGAQLQCDRAYLWSDTNGTFSLQRKCGTSKAPWGWRLSAALRPAVVGNLNESGLTWTRNGTAMPSMAGHVVPPDYQFHGTFNPAKAGNSISYSDYVRFRHNIGGGGNATIHLFGSFTLTNNPPCQPGNPC